MGSFHQRFPTESCKFAGPNTDSADFAVFLVRFAEGTSLGLPKKNQSLRGRSFTTALSKINSYRFEGLTPEPSKTQSFMAVRGFNTAPSKTPSPYGCRGFNTAPSETPSLSFFSDPLTSLIYPQMFFPFPPLSDSALLNFCHSSAPIRFDTFQLKPHGRRCLGTHCVSRRAAVTGSGANKNTLLKRLL
ncbi:hypothetical protein TNCV_4783021 [Trichonephila clavipes]|nr:hypothetical protein TNCV_4783021 [Trichonephila clavipes]